MVRPTNFTKFPIFFPLLQFLPSFPFSSSSSFSSSFFLFFSLQCCRWMGTYAELLQGCAARQKSDWSYPCFSWIHQKLMGFACGFAWLAFEFNVWVSSGVVDCLVGCQNRGWAAAFVEDQRCWKLLGFMS